MGRQPLSTLLQEYPRRFPFGALSGDDPIVGARKEHLIIGSSFQDDPDVCAVEPDLHLSLEPGFLLQFFRKKREAVLGGRLPSKFSLETEIALYNSYISQMEHELACSKEKERDLSER